MGGCDFSIRPYTYDDVPGDVNLEHFNLTEDDLIYKVIPLAINHPLLIFYYIFLKKKIPYMKQATEVKGKPLTFFASPWSAPAWMKSNNGLIGKGYLLPKYYQTWADYFIKYSSTTVQIFYLGHFKISRLLLVLSKN